MWSYNTRAKLRDAIRRKLGKVPAVDLDPTASFGEPASHQKHPSNALLNQAIEEAVAKVNRRVGVGRTTTPIEIALAATTTVGPRRVDLRTGWTGASAGQIHNLREVWWEDASGNITVLLPGNVDEMALAGRDYHSDAVGTPSEYWTEGYSLWILPGNSGAGTLYARAGVGLSSPMSDSDSIGEVPDEYYPVFVTIAAREVCATQLEDTVMADRYRHLTPEAEAGIADIARWFNETTTLHQPRLTYKSNRRLRTR